MTPSSVTPQGAQSPDQLRELAIGLLHPSGRSLSDKETAGYINDLAEAVERIEKLEREKQLHAGDTLSLSNELDEWKERAQDAEHAKDEIEQQAIAAGIAWAYERDALKGERDTALRALAEARRKYAVLANASPREFCGWHNWCVDHPGKTMDDAVMLVLAASQPEKDANNG